MNYWMPAERISDILDSSEMAAYKEGLDPISACLQSLDLSNKDRKYAQGYYEFLVLKQIGAEKEAYDIFDELDASDDFADFMTTNAEVIVALDLAVTGETKKMGVIPAFRINAN